MVSQSLLTTLLIILSTSLLLWSVNGQFTAVSADDFTPITDYGHPHYYPSDKYHNHLCKRFRCKVFVDAYDYVHFTDSYTGFDESRNKHNGLKYELTHYQENGAVLPVFGSYGGNARHRQPPSSYGKPKLDENGKCLVWKCVESSPRYLEYDNYGDTYADEYGHYSYH